MRNTTKLFLAFAAVLLIVIVAATMILAAADEKPPTKPKQGKKPATPTKGASNGKKTKSTPEPAAPAAAGKEQTMESDSDDEQQQQPQQKAAPGSARNTDSEAEDNYGDDDSQAHQQQQQQQAPFASSSSSNIKNGIVQTVHIKGSLQNMTRTIRDPATGQVRKVNPPDVARIAVDGGAHVFYADAHGQFELFLELPVVNNAAAANSNNAAPRILVHQIDIDWHRTVFPRVLVEVDEFGNFRSYIDGSGKIVASRGKIGSDPKTRSRFEVVEDPLDDPEYAHVMEFMQIAAVGDMEYFVPRQEFRIFDMLKNPMVLMMVVTAGMVFVMPKLIDQDEMKAQMKELSKMKDAATGGGDEKKLK